MGLEGAEIVGVIVYFVVLFLLLFFGYTTLMASYKIVHHAEVMVIERFGKYRTTLKPGLNFLIPYVDVPRVISWRYVTVPPGGTAPIVKMVTTDRIDMREHVIDFGKQHVITKDTVSINIDALVYYQITDAELAVFKVQNLPDSIELLTQATLRNIIASMNLDDTFSSREEISALLKEKTLADAERWGVTIVRLEIMNIEPPPDIKTAMEKQIKEERERRSTVLQADGERESAIVRSRGDAAKTILQAEGTKTSRVQLAKGEAEAKLMTANAEAQCITNLRSAMTDDVYKAADYLVAMQYLNSLRHLTYAGTPSDLVLLPSRTVQNIGDMVNYSRTATVGGRR